MTIKVTRALRIGSRINNSTSGSILFVDSSGNLAQDNSELFWDDSNNRLGLGQTTPVSRLHLDTGATTEVGQIIQGVAGQSANLSQWKNSAGTVLGVVDASGNIGIGTSSPGAALHVNSDSGTVQAHIDSGGTGDAYLRFLSAGTSKWNIRNDYTGSGVGGHALVFRDDGNVVVLVLGQNGNVGIGTDSPTEKLEVSGHVTKTSDNHKYYSGAGKDMSSYYDGTDGYIKTDEVAPSDLHVVCGAEKTLILDNVTYEDVPTFLSSARVPAANAPNWESLVGNLNAYAYQVNDYQEFTAELLHGYKEGSTFEFHVHAALNATLAGGDETVKFEIEYSIADMDYSDGIGDVFPATTTINQEFTVPNGTADLTSLYISIGSDSTGSFLVGATIQARVRRIASSGTELVGDIFVTQVGIHYQKDTIGSRQLAIK